MLETNRMPAVAGMFYPGEPQPLARMIDSFLAEAQALRQAQALRKAQGTVPKAIIAPHAGYIYSGPVAASVYARVRQARGMIERVVLLGPSHRVAFAGLAASSMDYFVTPLGKVPLDREAINEVLSLPQVCLLDQAHSREHSLEVHLPFLQRALGEFKLVPLVVGEAAPREVAEVLEKLWGGKETLIVISSDLSHYHDYQTAQQMDKLTSQAIEALRPEDIRHDQACGRHPVNGLLYLAKHLGLKAETVDLRNSGDTAGSKDQVVGYGAYVFH